MFKLPIHNRFIDVCVNRGTIFRKLQPSNWIINEPYFSRYNIWNCIYNDPMKTISSIKSPVYNDICNYGNAGLYLQHRDYNKIYDTDGKINDDYFTEEIENLSDYMHNSRGKISNRLIDEFIKEEIDTYDFVYADCIRDEYNICKTSLKYIDNSYAKFIVLDVNTPENLAKYRAFNVQKISNLIILITNY